MIDAPAPARVHLMAMLSKLMLWMINKGVESSSSKRIKFIVTPALTPAPTEGYQICHNKITKLKELTA